MAEDTGNWTNLTGVDYDGWDPDTDPPLSCYSVHNEYTTKAYLVPIYQIIGPILVNLCALSVIGNTVILCTVFFIRKKHLTPTLMFSLSLAGADAVAAMSMGLGFFVNNILLLNFDINIAYRDCIVLVVESFRLATMVCSALHFLMLAVNHWLGIIRPLHYASRMTRKLAWICIVVMWVSPLVGFFAVFSLMPGRGFRSTKCQDVEFAHRFPFRAAVSALFFIPVTLMSVVYVHVFIVLYFHRKRLLSLDVTGSNNDEKRRMQSNTKALVTTLIILLTYLIGWLPAVINYVLVCDGCIFPLTISLCIRLPTNIVTNLLIVLKFLVDPIIYTARIQEVRMVINYPLQRWGLTKRDTTHRAFDRFDSSRHGSLMTSLRYSTYGRSRKESDSSGILQRVATPRSHHLTVTAGGGATVGGSGSVVRRNTAGSNGFSIPVAGRGLHAPRQSWPVAPPVYPAHSPLMEVSESLVPVTTPLDADDKLKPNGSYGTID